MTDDSVNEKAISEAEKELRFTLKQLKRNKRGCFGAGLIILLIIAALFAPYIAPFDPLEMDLDNILQSPNRTYLIGTDEVGRDNLSRLIYGARLSLKVGLSAVSLKMFLSVTMGLLAGYFGGSGFIGQTIDHLIMRTLDVIYAFPRILLALLILAVTGPSVLAVILVLSITGLPRFTRIIRGAVLSVKERDYIMAAEAIGLKKFRIILRHVLPNVFSPILILLSFETAHIIMSEASLSFLGFGAETTIPSWGNMLSEGRSYIRQHPGMVMYPGIAIMLTVMAFNFLGDAIRDVLDPRFRRK